MNISLPEPPGRFGDQQVREGGFASTSDDMREPIGDRQRRSAGDRLRGQIAEGLASGPAEPVDKAWFDDMRKRACAKSRRNEAIANAEATGSHARCRGPGRLVCEGGWRGTGSWFSRRARGRAGPDGSSSRQWINAARHAFAGTAGIAAVSPAETL